MMTSYFNLLKYAQTGIASPDMTYYDRMRASTLMGGAVQTLTGQPPLSFKADGSPLISWLMKGNTQQTGTPSPDNIIIPTFCGVRTKNVMPSPTASTETKNGVTCTCDGNGKFTLHGTASESTQFTFTVPKFTIPASVGQGGDGTFSMFNSFASSSIKIVFYDSGTMIDYWSFSKINNTNTSYSAMGRKRVTSMILNVSTGVSVDGQFSLMLTDDGQLPNKFEPYGWAEKITCAGQTVPVYLGQTQTVRKIRKLVLDGTENWIYRSGEPQNVYSLEFAGLVVVSNSGLCTHYQNQDSGSFSTLADKHVLNRLSPDSSKTYIAIRDSSFSLLSDFKEYLAAQYAAGTPVTVWYVLAEPTTGIVNEPLAKIGDYADELHITNEVTIPTVKGSNTLTVDTPIQPSEMSITYKG